MKDEQKNSMEDELKRQINGVRNRFYETPIPNHSMNGLSSKYYISDYLQKSIPNPSAESELDYFLDELETATNKLESSFSQRKSKRFIIVAIVDVNGEFGGLTNVESETSEIYSVETGVSLANLYSNLLVAFSNSSRK